MVVKDLIKKLQEFPEDAEVLYWYDSAARGDVGDVVVNKNNDVVLFGDVWPHTKSDVKKGR